MIYFMIGWVQDLNANFLQLDEVTDFEVLTFN